MSAIDKIRFHWGVDIYAPLAGRMSAWQSRRTRRWDSDVIAPPLEVSYRNRELVTRHWLEGRYAHLNRKVVWVTSGAPVEIFRAMDFYIVYPENHAAICGSARIAVDLASEAEQAGFSQDLCSYARTDFGSVFSGKTPVGMIARPDLLVACTNICQTVLSWYRVLARHFQVPLIIIDTPFVYYENASDHAVAYVIRQLEQAIEVAERVAGKPLKQERLEEVAQYSRQATQLWMEIMQRNRAHPAPISVFDQFTQMAPIVEMRGEPATVDFYGAMLKEVDQRIAAGVGSVKDETKRLLWDNLPIWYRLRYLAEFFGKFGISIVASTYTNGWGELAPLIDPSKGLESMAQAYLHAVLNRGTGYKLATMVRMIDEFQLDGVILHSDRSCKPYSIGQMDQRDRLMQVHETPALLLEADHNDSRAYSEQPVANRLDAFVELLGIYNK